MLPGVSRHCWEWVVVNEMGFAPARENRRNQYVRKHNRS
jgi:hypothetical protein